jgi:hypothetical protein
MNNLQEILQDIVSHTHSLGFLPLVKSTTDETETTLESIAPDRTVVLYGKIHNVVPDFTGVIGFPNMEKLAHHLKNPEYKENATIQVVPVTRNGSTYPDHIYFENASGDFRNEYRFMNSAIINEKMKGVKFRGVKWDLNFIPSPESIKRLKLQSVANSEQKNFQVKTDGTNLVITFGNASTHVGSFVFATDITGSLSHTWEWPVDQTMSILNLDGEKHVYISDNGAMKIEVDSGLVKYEYILPAATK